MMFSISVKRAMYGKLPTDLPGTIFFLKSLLFLTIEKICVFSNRNGRLSRAEAEQLKFAMTAGDNGKLFGSVTSSLIGEELDKLGFDIDRRRIEVPEGHIRFTGEYSVRIKLYGQEEAKVKVLVERLEK
jgi:hypothetical protein